MIKNAIENLKDKMSKDGAIHGSVFKFKITSLTFLLAQEMHATNAGMRQMRQQMEATFRKELVMDILTPHYYA